MIVTIIGMGFVGKATLCLANEKTTFWTYDINPEMRHPPDLTYEKINRESDLVFVAVPTPMNIDGSCNTSILEDVLSRLDHRHVVIRSTVPVGYSKAKGCYFAPEFLTEKNWQEDVYNCDLWVFGENTGCPEFRKKIDHLIDTAFEAGKIRSNKRMMCPTTEAEMIKLVRNNFLSTKVVFFNEIRALCESLGIDYEHIRRGAGGDPRIGESHTLVDGREHIGYGGTCFPKDTNSLFHIFQQNGLRSSILEANLYVNEYLINRHKPWLDMYNRAITRYDGEIVVYAGVGGQHAGLLTARLEERADLFIIGITDREENDVITHERYCQQAYDLGQKFFIPRCDGVVLLVGAGEDTTRKVSRILNIKTFTDTYRIPLTVSFEDPIGDRYLLDWMTQS